MNTLDLTILDRAGAQPLRFPVRRVINAGYVGRNRQAVLAHIEELVREGIPPPQVVPMVFPFPSANLTTADRIEVSGATTSGEAEYVLLLHEGAVYVGVGSDHTDRALERHDLVKSKQVCANVLSREVWRYQDVEAHWDELLLQSWVRMTATGPEVLYQKAPLGSILAADALLDLVRSSLRDPQDDGLVIFSGTIPLCAGQTLYGEHFRAELFDPRTAQRLTCGYRAERLSPTKRNGSQPKSGC
jgi:hypothetical protein